MCGQLHSILESRKLVLKLVTELVTRNLTCQMVCLAWDFRSDARAYCDVRGKVQSRPLGLRL